MKTTALCIALLCTTLIHAVELDLGANGKLALDQPKGWTVKTLQSQALRAMAASSVSKCRLRLADGATLKYKCSLTRRHLTKK